MQWYSTQKENFQTFTRILVKRNIRGRKGSDLGPQPFDFKSVLKFGSLGLASDSPCSLAWSTLVHSSTAIIDGLRELLVPLQGGHKDGIYWHSVTHLSLRPVLALGLVLFCRLRPIAASTYALERLGCGVSECSMTRSLRPPQA